MDSYNNERYNTIFKSVFCNIVILRNIYQYVKKYKENEHMVFEDLRSLRKYKNKDFIRKIEYRGGRNLVIGDLPMYGVLKEIKFTKITQFTGDVIPFGVELIEYSSNSNNNDYTTPFTTLPSTINTLINVIVIPINSNKDNSIYNQYSIPPNITSISFIKFPNITSSPSYNGFIKIPNTIKQLTFGDDWDNQGIPLSKGDLPEGIINLKMIGYKQITSFINSNEILPSTIKYLEIKLYGKLGTHFKYDFIPINVETLVLHKNGFGISNGLNECSSIKNLTIDFNDVGNAILKPNSIPSNVTNLSLINLGRIDKDSFSNNNNNTSCCITNLQLLFSEPNIPRNDIASNVIPNCVTHLTTNKIITVTGVLPNSITNFELVNSTRINPEYYSTKNVGKMIKIIDDKVIVKLPKEFHYPYLVKLFKNKNQLK